MKRRKEVVLFSTWANRALGAKHRLDTGRFISTVTLEKETTIPLSPPPLFELMEKVIK